MKVVHHIDGNPRNNDPSNLEIVDMKENTTRQEQATEKISIYPLREPTKYLVTRGNKIIAHVTTADDMPEHEAYDYMFNRWTE